MDPFQLYLTLFFIVILLVLSASFSMSETALTGTSKARMYQLERNGRRGAARINRLLKTRERVISTLLIGNTLVNILASSLMTGMFLSLLGAAGVVLATSVLTVVIVIFCEILPKTYAIRHAESTALFFGLFLDVTYTLLKPFAFVAMRISRFAIGLFGGRDKKRLLSAEDELRGAADLLHMQGDFLKDDRDMIGGLLDLKELDVYDVMIHRTKMVSLDVDLPNQEIVSQALSSPHTRIPLWKNEPENIVGLLHVKTLMREVYLKGGVADDFDILSVAMEPWFIPDTTAVQAQLKAFLRKKNHFAFVVDEYGEVLGHVTLEDIIEEIIGEISDEHDMSVEGAKKHKDGSVILDAQAHIRDLNRMMDWTLPDDEATTVAGLIIHEAQMIPEQGQAFQFHGFTFEILEREANKITSVKVKRD